MRATKNADNATVCQEFCNSTTQHNVSASKTQ